MIKVVGVSKNYTGAPVFENVSFTFSKNEVIALVGENGAGKTTLLKVLAGELEEYDGVVKIENEAVAYMPQVVSFESDICVGEFVEKEIPSHEKYKFLAALDKLGFENLDEYQLADTLSGGEKTKVYLASLMAKNPTILLLDEPTNNLDLEGIISLQNFLNSFTGKVLIVSHDRAFLDSVASRIFELEAGKFKEYVGSYTNYTIQKDKILEIQNKSYVNWMRKKDQLEKLVDLTRKIGAGVGAAKKRYEREVTKSEVENPYAYKESVNISLSGATHNAKLVLRVKSLTKSFKDKYVIKNVSFDIWGNERVWLYGKNGSGKTTLFKEIYNKINSINPESPVKLGTNITIGYYSQTQEILNLENTLVEETRRLGKISWQEAVTMLSRLKFEKIEWDRKVKGFSFGQRARLIFGAFSLGDYNFLMLDEPTNHLDIKTREIIEGALESYKGAMLLITHDRYFVQKLNITRVLKLEDGSTSLLNI